MRWWSGVLILLAGAAPAVSAQQGNRYRTDVPLDETMLVEFRVGRLAARTLPAYRRGAEALLPLREILRLAEIATERPTPTQLAFRSVHNAEWLVIDLTRGVVRQGKHERPLPAGAAILVGGEPYLASGALPDLLGSEVQVDWEDLSITVLDPEALPVALRVRRDALRRRTGAADLAVETPLAVAPSPAQLNGLVLDYAIAAPLQHLTPQSAAWSVGLGSEALGGGLTATISHGASAANRIDASWLKAWPDARGVAQLALGDAIATGPHARSVRGFALSNAPLSRADDYGVLPFGGAIAPGWDVEAWRGGRMVAEDSADALGRFRLDVPVQYGENAVEFVAYGPFGEVRRFSRAWGIHADAVAPGQLIYGIAGGACRGDHCDATLNADLRIGVIRGWTARAGVERFWRHRSGDLTHPYLALYGTVGAGLGVDFTAVAQAVTQATVTWSPTMSLRTSLAAARYDTSVVDPLLTPGGRRNQLTATAGWRRGSTSLDASLERFSAGDATSFGGRLVLSTSLRRVQWLASVRGEQNRTGAGPRNGAFTVGLDAFTSSIGNGLLRRATMRAGIDWSGADGAQRVRLATGLPLNAAVRVETGVSWRAGEHGVRLTMLIVGDLPSIRSTTSLDQGRSSAVEQTVQGSLLLDQVRHRIVARALPALSRGGASGRACLDRNGDGACTADEPGVAGIRVIASGIATTTDAQGRWALWDLAPYTATRVTIDTTSLAAPYLVPSFREAVIVPSANRFQSLDIAIAVGGIAEGMVQRNDSSGVTGMLLWLTRVGGKERIAVRTFSDGGFYAVGLRPGEWLVTPDPGELAGLALQAAPLSFLVAASPDGTVADGLRLRVRTVAGSQN